jgi:hypothetical protein
MPDKSVTVKFRAVSTGAVLSGLVALDLFFSLFCARFPLILYLLVGGFGWWVGGSVHKRVTGPSTGAKFIRGIGIALACFSAFGILAQLVIPVNWNTKCSWRYCSRAMGPGLFDSPFPVGALSCSAWHKCANEYQFSPGEYSRLLQRMEQQECAPP